MSLAARGSEVGAMIQRERLVLRGDLMAVVIVPHSFCKFFEIKKTGEDGMAGGSASHG
jgi:hypothetical protein